MGADLQVCPGELGRPGGPPPQGRLLDEVEQVLTEQLGSNLQGQLILRLHGLQLDQDLAHVGTGQVAELGLGVELHVLRMGLQRTKILKIRRLLADHLQNVIADSGEL